LEIIGTPERLAEVRETAFFRVRASVPAYAEPWECGLVSRPPAAVVLARQPRIGALGAVVVEAPAGCLDKPGEDAEETARRELREELGLEAAEWQVVATETLASPGYTDEEMWLYLAGALTEVPSRDVDDYIDAVRVPLGGLDRELQRFRRLAVAHDPKKDLKTLALLQALKIELLQEDGA
jgi:8-oxo-dGTP pyrophosphatase MutT (NUDIX family)